MISSIDLYLALGRKMDRDYYNKWLWRLLERNSSVETPRDFFLFRKSVTGYKGVPRELFISLSLAKAICFKEGTVVAKKLRYYIEDSIERRPIR